jgi:hypothetical protein
MRTCGARRRRRSPLAAAGFAGYQAVNDSSSKSVQLREDVRGQVDSAIEQLRGLIEDNSQ